MARQPIAFMSTRLPRPDARLPQKISEIENRNHNHHAQTTNSITSIKKEIAGVHGTITRYVTTINCKTATYHFYELDAQTLDSDWLESRERRREWVDYAEAIRRLQWKPELAQGLSLSSLAPRR